MGVVAEVLFLNLPKPTEKLMNEKYVGSHNYILQFTTYSYKYLKITFCFYKL